MEKTFFLISFFFISHGLFALCHQLEEPQNLQSIRKSSLSFQIIDIHDETKSQVIQEVVALQSSLIVNNQSTTELPIAFKENGFLTIRMDQNMIMEMLLNDAKIVTTRCQGLLVGYLILCKFTDFQWLRNGERLDLNFQSSLDELERYFFDNHIQEIEQIAVAHSFAKQGIGRQMVEIAKQLSPHGLSTYILYKPFTNEASLAFFSKQNFAHIATAHVLGRPPKYLAHEVFIELWMP